MSTEKAVAQEYYVIVKTFGAPSPEVSDAAAILGVCEGVNCNEDVLRRLKAISDGAASGGVEFGGPARFQCPALRHGALGVLKPGTAFPAGAGVEGP